VSAAGGLEATVILKAFTDAARVLVPFARMYIGPAVAVVESNIEGDRSEVDRQILMLAFNKLVLEAGTLPAAGAVYAPHTTAFTIDANTRMGNALDLPYVLGALRGLAVWAAAGPAPATDAAASRLSTANGATASLSSSAAAAAPVATSTRDLRLAARARGFTAAASRSTAGRRAPTGGCGCSGGGASFSTSAASGFTTASGATASLSSAAASRTGLAARRAARKPDCRDPRPHCDCQMTCGGRSCGCNATTSCTDCIPRGQPAGDRCACGTCATCAPPAPVTCEPWTPSCETRNRLRTALREAVCDVLACFEQAVCPAGTLDPAALAQWQTHLARCFADVFCKLLRGLREAICPPPPVVTPPSVAPAIDCLPCSYAVEDLR
jgi:hypothetical protein